MINDFPLIFRLQEKINEQINESTAQLPKYEVLDNDSSPGVVNDKYTSELINLFNNLNKHYRLKAYESLDAVKEIKTMQEFKLKLLFSVVIVSWVLFFLQTG